MRVSIVIPTFNRARLVTRLLRSFNATTYEDDYEVVVVDDGSTDFTEVALKALESTLSYPLRITRQPNGGPAVARNTGVALACGDVLAFVDDDHIVTPSWLSEITNFEMKGQDVGQCGRNISLPGRTPVARYCVHAKLHEMPTVNPDGTVKHFMSGNAAILRWAFVAAGGFDPKYKPALRGVAPGGEDTALSLALCKQGYRLRFNPNAVTYHAQKDRFHSYLREAYNFGQSRRRYDRQVGNTTTDARLPLQLSRSMFGFVKYPLEILQAFREGVRWIDVLAFPLIKRVGHLVYLLGSLRFRGS